jgi:hypothetical protein
MGDSPIAVFQQVSRCRVGRCAIVDIHEMCSEVLVVTYQDVGDFAFLEPMHELVVNDM